MNGIDKIISKINADADAQCNQIIAAAKAKCDKIVADGEKAGKVVADGIIADAKAEAGKTVAIAQSGALQQSRQKLLAAKVECINETLADVTKALKSLPADLYFKAVIKVAADNAMAGKCEARLNSDDHVRMPADFEEKLAAALKEKDCEAKLSSEPVKIGSGLVLDYGDIVINCSFEAIVEENADMFKAKISEILF